MLTIVSPGGAESFFVEGGRTPECEGLPPKGPPDLATLERVAAQFGMEFVGPPLAAGSSMVATKRIGE